MIAAANLSAYSASKFAVRGLTQSTGKDNLLSRMFLLIIHLLYPLLPIDHDHGRTALELGKHNIRVNAYAPARILTPMCKFTKAPSGLDSLLNKECTCSRGVRLRDNFPECHNGTGRLLRTGTLTFRMRVITNFPSVGDYHSFSSGNPHL